MAILNRRATLTIAGGVASTADGVQAASQKDIVVASATGFVVGGTIEYTSAAGLEYNTIASIASSTLTCTNNLVGEVSSGAVVIQVPDGVRQMAEAVPHQAAVSLTAPDAIEVLARNVKNARAWGLTGASDPLDVARAQTMFAEVENGDLLYFPAGTYYIADSEDAGGGITGHYLSLNGKSNITICGDGGETIFCSADGGSGQYGAWIYLNGCDHVEIRGITIQDTVKTRWQSYENALVLVDCNHIDVHHCQFGDMSNKHIHIQGTCQDIRIHDNELSGQGFNCNPGGTAGTDSYASVFLYCNGTYTTALKDIQIFRNHFHGNLYCITANDAVATPTLVVNLKVYDNIFEDSAGGVLARCNGFEAHGNVYRNIGWSHIDTWYYYVTTSDSHQRYYSKTRDTYSATPYTAPPSDAQTISPAISSALSFSYCIDAKIYGERFVGCGTAQLMTSGTAATAPIMYCVSPARPVIRDIHVDESTATAQVKTPMIYFVSSPTRVTLHGCRFNMSAVYGGSGANLIRVDGNAWDHSILDNKATNWGTVHYSYVQRDRFHVASAAPTAGTFSGGHIVWRAGGAAGSYPGWQCTEAGTMGTLNSGATTGSISTGSVELAVNAATDLSVGDYISIAGVTGTKRVTLINGTTITIDSAADATVTNAAVAWVAAIWKTMANLAS